MASVSATSSSSSTAELVEQLIYLDSQGLRTNEAKITSLKNQQSLVKSLNTQALDFKTATENLYKALTTPTKAITASKEGIAQITITDDLLSGNISLDVQQLATNLIVGGDKISGEIGISGSFTVGLGDKELTIDVEENDTISSIKDKINKITDSNVKASVIDGRLILTSKETGEAQFTFSDNDGILSKLGIVDSSNNAKNVIQQGQNAKFLVDGIEVERSSNVVSDVMEGVTFDLQDTGRVTFKIAEDTESLVGSIEAFIESYNKMVSSIESATNTSSGQFKGDYSLNNFKNQLKNCFVSASTPAFKMLSDIGIKFSTEKHGITSNLEISDKDKLVESLKTNKQEFVNLFFKDSNDNGKIDSTDGGILGTLNGYLERATSTASGSKGIFSIKEEGLESTIKQHQERSERLTASIEKKRSIYEKQFLYMDQMVELYNAQLSNLSNMMTQLGINSSSSSK